MIVIRYALVSRDETDKRIGSFGTDTEPLRPAHKSKVTPGMHKLLSSCFNMHPEVAIIDVVSLAGWVPGADMDLDLQPVVLVARKTEETRAVSASALAFSFPHKENDFPLQLEPGQESRI